MRRRTDDDDDDDDIVRDGESVRVPMTLCDAQMIEGIRARTRRYHYGVGYCRDIEAIGTKMLPSGMTSSGMTPSEQSPAQVSWPTQGGGVWPSWSNQVGAACRCEDGREGRLQRAPDNSSVLICQPLGDDDDETEDAMTLDASTTAYFEMKDALGDEWRKYGPRRDGCSCGGASDQEGTVGHINNQLAWPQGAAEGDECMTDDKRQGRLVRVNGKLVCRAFNKAPDIDRAGVSPQARRDAAYHAMVRDMQDAWRKPW